MDATSPSLATADVAHAAPAGTVSPLVGLVPAWIGASVTGPAFPCVCAPADNLALHRALTLAPAGAVLVCAAGGDVGCAYAGELMALDAQRRGIAGLVVWGAVRDADALEELRFPVFALGTCPLSPAKEVAPSVGEEAAVAGVRVAPGDLVVADRDGVLIVHEPDRASLEDAVARVRGREAEIRQRLTAGEHLAAQLGL